MDYVFSDEAKQMRLELGRQLTDLAAAHPLPVKPSDGLDPVQRSLAASGWDQLLTSPPGSLVEAVHVAEAFGAVPVPSPTSMTVGLVRPLLDSVGGPAVAALAAALDSGSVVAAPVPRLEPDGDGGWRWTMWSTRLGQTVGGGLAGSVDHVVDAPRASLVLAPVLCGAHPVLAVVRPDAATARVVAQTGLDLRWTVGTLQADECSPEQLIDPPGLSLAVTHAAVRFSLALDAEAVGGAQEVLRRTVAYVSGRRQFGRPVGSFQAVRHRVSDMAVRIETSRSLLHQAAWSLEADGPQAAFEDVAVSRLHAARTYREVCEAAIQCHGGMGFTWEQGLHVFYRAALTGSALLSDVPQLVSALAQRLASPSRRASEGGDVRLSATTYKALKEHRWIGPRTST